MSLAVPFSDSPLDPSSPVWEGWSVCAYSSTSDEVAVTFHPFVSRRLLMGLSRPVIISPVDVEKPGAASALTPGSVPTHT